MLTALYPYVYTAIVVFSIVWMYRKNTGKDISKMVRGMGMLSAIYALIWISGDGTVTHKLFGVFFRDAFLLAILLVVAKIAATNGQRLALMLVGVLASMLFFYKDVLNSSFVTANELSADSEILFDLTAGHTISEVETALSDYSPVITKAFPDIEHDDYSNLEEYYTLDLPQKYVGDIQDILAELAESGLIDYAEQNEIIRLDEPDEDTEDRIEGTTWLVNDPRLDEVWAFDKMKVNELYALLNSGQIRPVRKAKIAILDTGVDSEHEDIAQNFVSTDQRYNKDVQGHGTHCAGIAGAVSNNGKGIASLSPDNSFVEITSIKVLSDEGWGTQQQIIAGIIRAADKGADVISMSLGGSSTDKRQKAYEEAISYAQKAGAIVVVAAGNERGNAINHVPASCEGVITVSAVDNDLNMASFSNHISDVKRGIAAPGVGILSSIPGNKYAAWNGTSMATPYVSGLVGMMKAVNPELTTDEVYAILSGTGVDTKNTAKTGKFIQPVRALQETVKSGASDKQE